MAKKAAADREVDFFDLKDKFMQEAPKGMLRDVFVVAASAKENEKHHLLILMEFRPLRRQRPTLRHVTYFQGGAVGALQHALVEFEKLRNGRQNETTAVHRL